MHLFNLVYLYVTCRSQNYTSFMFSVIFIFARITVLTNECRVWKMNSVFLLYLDTVSALEFSSVLWNTDRQPATVPFGQRYCGLLQCCNSQSSWVDDASSHWIHWTMLFTWSYTLCSTQTQTDRNWLMSKLIDNWWCMWLPADRAYSADSGPVQLRVGLGNLGLKRPDGMGG